MNAVEIEEAVSALAEAPFDAESFPFAFLEAFGNKETTLKKLKTGASSQSDLPGAVLQRNNIHLKVCPEGQVTATLAALRESPKTTAQKCKFILATDGKTFEAENLADGETVACAYPDFHHYFGFFLPLAGITTPLKAREAHFPATIADLYDPDTMPANLRPAHERNDETLGRIYIAAALKTTPNGWKNSLNSTPR